MPEELLVILVICAIVLVLVAVHTHKKVKEIEVMSPADRKEHLEIQQASLLTRLYGPLNLMVVCPHCQEKGHVRQKAVKQKKGISGGKATAAILTGGVSMLATGLSRKEDAIEAHCGNCRSRWNF